jgi:hypothetical protein
MSRKCDLCGGLGWIPVRHCDCYSTTETGLPDKPDPCCPVCFGEGSLPVPWNSPKQRVRRCECKRGRVSQAVDAKTVAAGGEA